MSIKKLSESRAVSLSRLKQLAGITTTGESEWAGTPRMAVRQQVNHGQVKPVLKESKSLEPAFEGPERKAYISDLLKRLKAGLAPLDKKVPTRAGGEDSYYELNVKKIRVTNEDEDGYEIYIEIPFELRNTDWDGTDGDGYVRDRNHNDYYRTDIGKMETEMEADVNSILKKVAPEVELVESDGNDGVIRLTVSG